MVDMSPWRRVVNNNEVIMVIIPYLGHLRLC